MGKTVACITGSTTMGRKHSFIDKFQNGKIQILVLTYKICGVGLNLTKANHIVFAEVCEKSSIETQALGRVLREGQTRTIHVKSFIATHTFEERMPLAHNSRRRVYFGS